MEVDPERLPQHDTLVHSTAGLAPSESAVFEEQAGRRARADAQNTRVSGRDTRAGTRRPALDVQETLVARRPHLGSAGGGDLEDSSSVFASEEIPLDDVEEIPPGTKIGAYRILASIGKGGLAQVYLASARDKRGLATQVAIKRIRPQYARAPEVVATLVDEARIAVLLNHPNVVRVHELVERAGELFLVLEYIDGASLSGLARALAARGETLSNAAAAWVIAEVLAGLHAAHVQLLPMARLRGSSTVMSRRTTCWSPRLAT